jgi:hypothetical protein
MNKLYKAYRRRFNRANGVTFYNRRLRTRNPILGPEYNLLQEQNRSAFKFIDLTNVGNWRARAMKHIAVEGLVFLG